MRCTSIVAGAVAVMTLKTPFSVAIPDRRLQDFSIDDVQELLGDWNLQDAFGTYFARLQIDGDMLHNDLKPEHIDLGACADANGAHVSKLFRKLKSLKSADGELSLQKDARKSRQLSETSAAKKSGLRIASNESSIVLGQNGDVVLSRTPDAGLHVSPHLTVEESVVVPSIDSIKVGQQNVSYFSETVDTHIFCGAEPIKLTRSVPITQTFTTAAEYELSFDINPYGTTDVWSSVIHFTASGENCCEYGDRIPAIWFYADTTRLHIIGGTNSSGNANFNPVYELPMNQWTTIRLRTVDDEGRIYYNDTYMGSISTDQRLPHDDVQVWMADPWHEPARAWLRNVKYQRIAFHHANFYNDFTKHDLESSIEERIETLEEFADYVETTYWNRTLQAIPDNERNWHTFVGPTPITLHNGAIVSKTFTTGAEYELTFDIKPFGTTTGWNNILHFTSTGENCCNYGDRIPSIWFYTDSTRLHIVSASNSSGNAAFNPVEELPLNAWTTVRLRSVGSAGDIYYNDTYMGTIDTQERLPHDNVEVWMSDPWHARPKAYLRNVKYELISYHHANYYDNLTPQDKETFLDS